MKKFLLSALSAVAAITSAFAAELPYSQTFDSSADFSTLTLYHASSDSRDWDYSSSAARFYPGSRYSAYDAWFFLPALDLQAGKQYVITFDTKISSSGSSNWKDLSVNFGTDATPETQTELWRENITTTSYTGKKLAFTPDADGSYVIGFRADATSGSMNDIFVDNIKVDAYLELPGLATDITATPGEKGALSVTLSWTNPAVNDGGNALSQLSGVKIYRTDSSWASISDNILVATVTDGIAPGEVSTYVDETIPKSGNYYYYIEPFNENGKCPLSISSVKTSGYVGPDAGLSATKNVVATAVEDNEKAIALTWDAPSGTNGGYVDPSNISWKITRKGPATVVVAEDWNGELPYNYVDETITELGAYTYTVQYINNGTTENNGATSNKVITGGTAALPYTQDFSSSTALDLFSVFNGENSSTTTKWAKPSTYYSYVQLNQSSGTMDAWLVTPPFELKAGTYYDLEFSTSASATSSKALEVMTGSEPTADGLTQSVFDETLSLTSTMSANTARFKADADGRFYIGFHAKGTSGSGYFRLTNIKLTEVVVAPMAAADLTATADPDGALLVNLAWTNPATDVLGNELSSLAKVEVLRGTDVIMTYEDATPGQAMTLTDEVEAPGKYTYTVIAYLGENASEPASVTSDKVGGAMELPYNVEFTSEDAVAEWTLPAIADGTTWKFDASKGCLTAPDYKSGLWLFSPDFKAKKGTVKVVLCGASRSSSSSYVETVNVALYKSTDPAAEPVTKVITYTFSSTSKTYVNFEFDVTDAGTYTVGIARPKYGWELYIYGASIEQTATLCETAPLAATDLTVTADEDDEALVHLSWVNPSKNVGGDDLAEITKAEVLRDGEVIATLTDDLTPGEAVTYDDTVPASGVYTYTVVVYNGEDASDPVSAKSPFIGGGFELPYSVELSTADATEFWTLPENASGKYWKFDSSTKSLMAGSSDITAFTAPLKMEAGEISVTFKSACYGYRYPETVKVGLFSAPSADALPVGDWQSQEITSNKDYPETNTLTFSVPEKGAYYVCFYIESSAFYYYLMSVDVAQTEVAVEDIVVLWDNTDANFAKPVLEVNGEDIEMTPYVTPALLALTDEEDNKILDTHIYMAQIPGNAETVKFKDGEDGADSEPVEIANPKHMYIYNADGQGKSFDENDVTGIEDINVDNAEARYFDLRGVEVASPRQGNVYIVVRGQKASKMLVK